jgi:hypothetical protein
LAVPANGIAQCSVHANTVFESELAASSTGAELEIVTAM